MLGRQRKKKEQQFPPQNQTNQPQYLPQYRAGEAEIDRQIAAEPKAYRVHLNEVFERPGEDAGASLLTGDFARLDAECRATEGSVEDRMRQLDLVA